MSPLIKITCTSTRCSYAQSGNWATSDTKNPIYIGNNSSGSYKYVGQWRMPAIDTSNGDIKRVYLHIYRNSNNSSSGRSYYVGCTSRSTDSASVLSTGVTFLLSAGQGWKTADVSDLSEYIKSFASDWYLLIGNPNTNGTYAEVAGYGSGNMLYLEIEFSNGSKIYLASNGVLKAYQLYHAENGALVRYDLYHGENGALVKY